jgi:hypothetical protein
LAKWIYAWEQSNRLQTGISDFDVELTSSHDSLGGQHDRTIIGQCFPHRVKEVRQRVMSVVSTFVSSPPLTVSAAHWRAKGNDTRRKARPLTKVQEVLFLGAVFLLGGLLQLLVILNVLGAE